MVGTHFRSRLAVTSALGAIIAASAAAPAAANTVNGAPVTGQVISVTVPDSATAPGSTTNIVVSSADVYGPGSIGLTTTVAPTERTNSSAIEVRSPGATNITINAGRIVGAHNSYTGIWVNPSPGAGPRNVTIVNNGDIYGDFAGIDVRRVCNPGLQACPTTRAETLSISGTGRVFGNTRAINVIADTITLDGHSLIFGVQGGLVLAGNTIDVGQTTRLGAIWSGTAVGSGSALNIATPSDLLDGTARLRLSSIAALTGVNTANTNRKDIRLEWNGSITTLSSAISLFSFNTVIDGEGTGTIVAGLDGINLRQGGTFTDRAANFTISRIASISASRIGIIVQPTSPMAHTTTIDSIGSITAGGDGMVLSGFGTFNVGNTGRIGPITAGATGVRLFGTDDTRTQPATPAAPTGQTVSLRLTSITAGIGIFGTTGPNTTTGPANGTTSINFTGAISAQSTGIYLYRYTGPVIIDGETTGSVTSQFSSAILMLTARPGVPTSLTVRNLDQVIAAGMNMATGDGIALENAGTLNVSNVRFIYGTNGIFARGSVSIQGNGTISGVSTGISVLGFDSFEATTVDIGGSAFNAGIGGGVDGIRAEARGTIRIATNDSVYGDTGHGIRLRTAGTVSVNLALDSSLLNPDGVRGALGGMLVQSAGGTIELAPSAIIQGATALQIQAIGASSALSMTVTNRGRIASTEAVDTANYFALISDGSTTVNNTGDFFGKVRHSPTPEVGVAAPSLAFNNQAGGRFGPGSGESTFGGTADIIDNAGLLALGPGTTVFQGLETLRNRPTGTIQMTLPGIDAIDELVISGALILEGGTGAILMTYDLFSPLGTFDRGTTGRADTIVAGSVQATGVSRIVLGHVGITYGSTPTVPLVGSVALIAIAGSTPPSAPSPGATLVQSPNFAFHPTISPNHSGRTFALVGDGIGGLYLQWVPTISGGSVGGFLGGSLDATGGASGASTGSGSLGFLQASLAGATQAVGQVANLTGFGAAFGGAGAAGAGCGASAGAAFSVRTGEWAAQGSRAGSGARAVGRDLAFSPGAGADSCGRVSVGAFQFGGQASVGLDTAGLGDSARGAVEGAGGYVRADSGTGFYAQLTGAAGTQRAWVRNSVFGTQATLDTRLGLVDATVGYARPVREGVAVETRVSVSRLTSQADPFRDSAGFEVSRITSIADSVSATVGLLAKPSASTQGFIRAGIRTTDARLDGVAYGRRTLSEANGTATVVEAGWTQALGGESSLEFALSSETGGLVEQQELRLGYAVSW